MDLKGLEYVIAIADEQSISKASEKIHLSQSALNQHLLRLEKDLGILLFSRIGRKMITTKAGEIYVSAARVMLQKKQETYCKLAEIQQQGKAKEISIAFSPEQGCRMFARIFPLFHEQYPDISFHVVEARSKKMEQLLIDNQVDLACLVHVVENPLLTYMDARTEHVVLAMPITHPLAYLAGDNSFLEFPSIDLGLLAEDIFVLPLADSVLRGIINRAFSDAKIHPQVLFEAANNRMVRDMVIKGTCLGFFQQSYVQKELPLVYFSFGTICEWSLGTACRKGYILSEQERTFISFLRRNSSGDCVLQESKNAVIDSRLQKAPASRIELV
ncbi:LysR family transcriptional regulator [uncultured Sphaerochaeta sp.]|uniref:LysR family transcriptional regulator n=1 Tax=uncultured Sphaerochaeta sp. TaxID=886478 RepID=UPI002A0A80E5|nr:LysR family transcriptional regulator [uncultured Sphaerochaeta sp.]